MKRYPGLIGLLVVLVSVAGCRFYGYPGGVALTLAQIEAASEQVAQDLEQALAELEALRLLARRDETLAPYVAQYEAILEAHQQAVLEFEHWKEQVAAHPGDYRRANRTLGAITARHEALLQQYADVAWAVAQHVNPALLARAYTSSGPRFFFYVVPPQYARQVNEQAVPPLQVVRYLAAQLS
ncbi:hypothetical protein [Rhodothermus marinus]|uniref:Uncharacterized protein n=1 Tax=Rhodothermus marinus (strain ATCC 43812 / DSM 4252 / R-10) TaxID=518766 RepID=D0MKF0_RHOM4|nr:hypothetical protein [Rhodothermus marinus]ACY48862.1 hypothetical protein Rmar_1979 [Rhodothermus marinus DSM 4252]6F0K_H Chain H, ActH [Rhodothermus marinus DSM 4252]